MSGIYHLLAPFYDALNSDVDYVGYADYIDSTLRHHIDGTPKAILDLGCGTGNVTIPLAKLGYRLIGLDLSPEMLSVAQDHIYEEGLEEQVFLTMQDMTDFEIGDTVDAVVCTLDGINHLQDAKMVSSCFASVREALSEGGLFLFDLNSKRKFVNVYGDEAYTMETEGAYCVWQNVYRERSRTCDFYINLFVEEDDGRYVRYEDVERERYYPLATIQKLLSKNAFVCVGIYGGMDGHPVTPEDDRWYIVAKAIACEKETL